MARAKPKSATKTKPTAKTARRLKPTARRAPPTAKPRSQQTFTASHHREEDFKGGLRSYATYRDLGVSRATNGMVQAHVIRFLPPCRPEVVSKRHYHDVDFQMIYVLKGWIKTRIDGQGELMMRAGGSWIQPPRVEHAVLDYSDDCEVLEIVLPADFETVELE
jgi:Cupin domain